MKNRFEKSEVEKIRKFLISRGYSVPYKTTLHVVNKELELNIKNQKYFVRLKFEFLPWKNNFLSINCDFSKSVDSFGGYTVSNLYYLEKELEREIPDNKIVLSLIKKTADVIYTDLKETALFLKREKINDKIIFFNTSVFEGDPFGIHFLKKAGISYYEYLDFVFENFRPNLKENYLYEFLSDYIGAYKGDEIYDSVFNEIKKEYFNGFFYLMKKIYELNEKVEAKNFMHNLNTDFVDFFLSTSDIETASDLKRFDEFYFFGILYQNGIIREETERIYNEIKNAVSVAELIKNNPAVESRLFPPDGFNKSFLKLKKILKYATDYPYMFKKEDFTKIIQTGILCFKYFEYDLLRKKEKSEIKSAVLKAAKKNPLFLLESLKNEKIFNTLEESLKKNRYEILKNVNDVFKTSTDLKLLKKAIAYFGNIHSEPIIKNLPEFNMYKELKKFNYAKKLIKKIQEKTVIKEKEKLSGKEKNDKNRIILSL